MPILKGGGGNLFSGGPLSGSSLSLTGAASGKISLSGSTSGTMNLTVNSTATALIPSTAAEGDFGTSALPICKDFYLAGTSGTPATMNFKLTGAATGLRTITLPDATGTVINSGIVGLVTDTMLANAVKPAVAVVATTNLTLSGEQTIDGQLTSGSLVLATGQTTGAENGPWMTAAGAWSRPGWYTNGSTTQAPQFLTTFVRLGTTYQGSTWRMTTASVTIGTTATTWVQTPTNINSVVGALPAGTGMTTPVITGLPTGSGVASAATASTLVARDANGNINVNSTNHGYTTTATAAGTTTLTVASTNLQYFTGSTTQIVLLPVTSTLVLGQRFVIVNNSTGLVTVQSSGANIVQVMGPNTSLTVTCILTSGTTAASWNGTYAPINTSGITDSNGNMMIGFSPVASAADYFSLINAAAGNTNIDIQPTGPDWDTVTNKSNLRFNSGGSGSSSFPKFVINLRGSSWFSIDTNTQIAALGLAGASNFVQLNGGNVRIKDSNLGIWQNASGILEVNSGTAGTLRDVKVRNVLVGTATAPSANDTAVIAFQDNVSKPTLAGTLPTAIYNKGGEMFVQDSAGNETQISPHEAGTDHWIFYSENERTGRRIKVDMEKLVRVVEQMSGEKIMEDSKK